MSAQRTIQTACGPARRPRTRSLKAWRGCQAAECDAWRRMVYRLTFRRWALSSGSRISTDPHRGCGSSWRRPDEPPTTIGQSIEEESCAHDSYCSRSSLSPQLGEQVLLDRGPDAGEQSVWEHSASVPETARTVTISATMPAPSTHPRRLSAMLEAGAMPHGPMMAEVLTDTDCAPDRRMVSRCRNEMLLANGRRIVVRHPHDMSSVPCLAPEEQVLLVPTSV
jgi:hypothetical protein